LEPGSVVLLVEPNNPRGRWPYGLSEEVYQGSDGHVRTVKVRSGDISFLRPITRLCPLLSSTSKMKSGDVGEEKDNY
jgi:hypothetical protein